MPDLKETLNQNSSCGLEPSPVAVQCKQGGEPVYGLLAA